MAIREEMVTYPADGGPLTGLLALPEEGGPFPAVVVIHEAYGLNDNIKEITRRFAGEGYVALGVDLFSNGPTWVCMARFFSGVVFNSLDHSGIKGLKASLDFLARLPKVDGKRVGAVGYCLGGSFAVAWACTDNRLRAIAPYYAQNPRPLKAVERACPVVGSYPTGDPITSGDGHKLDARLDQYGIDHDIKHYPGAKHGFFNDTSTKYNEAAAKDSWERVRAFFEEHVKVAG
ncbi:MAG: dienelactone hydrolase family protein [Candidatus Dormiibacterota bacterium]